MQTDRVAVAYSGGRDSTALLHAACRLAAERRQVMALHVHHGLSEQADAWLAHCRCQCETGMPVPVRFVATRLTPDRRTGESVEAWARRGRYAALAEMALANGFDHVLLAHHRRDQAETLLLQALRGGGVAGLAAMPVEALRAGVRWCRPWLGRTRAEIDRYLAVHCLPHVEDDSNHDPRFGRNRLRLQVWPALHRAFPEAEQALAASAAWAGEAAALADEIAAVDLEASAPAGPLRLEDWTRLSPARRSNVLRAWCRHECGFAAPSALVVRLCTELPGRRAGRWPAVEGGELCLYDGELTWRPATTAPGHLRESRLAIAGPGRHPLVGWGGELVVEAAPPGAAGLALASLAEVELRTRSGGERFSFGPDRPARALKKQFQQVGVPPWQRDVPLLHARGRLVFVPGLGMDGAALCTAAHERPMRLSWSTGAPGPARPRR